MTRRRKWNKKLVILEVHKLHKTLKRRPVKRDSSILYQMSRKFFGGWNNAMKASGYKVKDFQKVKIPKTCSNFCYFIGLIISDGHLVYQPRDYRIIISTSYGEEKEIIYKLIKKLFKYLPYVRKRKYKNRNILPSYDVCIFSKNLCDFIRKKFKIPTGAKSSILRVPKIIFYTSKNNIGGFIRGIIDGDGSISIEESKISISSGSYLFLKDMKILLSTQNISSGKIVKDRNSYRLHVYNSNNNLIKLYNLIYFSKFYYLRKKLSWDKLLNNLN